MTDPNDRFQDKDHEHRWFPLQNGSIKNVFEPLVGPLAAATPLYRLVEYMYMFCSCGQAKRVKIDQPDKTK